MKLPPKWKKFRKELELYLLSRLKGKKLCDKDGDVRLNSIGPKEVQAILHTFIVTYSDKEVRETLMEAWELE